MDPTAYILIREGRQSHTRLQGRAMSAMSSSSVDPTVAANGLPESLLH